MKVKLYNGYHWTGRNPVLVRLQVAKEKAGITNAKIAEDSSVATGTLGRWWSKDPKKRVRRPQWDTVVATARAIPGGVDALIMCVSRDGKGKK